MDGIYTADPVKNPNAMKYDRISYMQAINENLRVMDSTAFTMCQEHGIPIVVYSLRTPGNTIKAATGKEIGTIVSNDE